MKDMLFVWPNFNWRLESELESECVDMYIYSIHTVGVGEHFAAVIPRGILKKDNEMSMLFRP